MAKDDTDRRIQIATTAHFTLITQRSATIAESTGRAGLFTSTVSLTMVALGFVSAALDMDRTFLALSGVLLFALVVLGGLTFLRLVQTGIEDLDLARRIERIEALYDRLAPGSVVWRDDDAKGRDAEAAIPGALGKGLQMLMTASALVAALNAFLAGAAIALLSVLGLSFGFAAAVALGCSLAAMLFAGQMALSRRLWRKALPSGTGGQGGDALS